MSMFITIVIIMMIVIIINTLLYCLETVRRIGYGRYFW